MTNACRRSKQQLASEDGEDSLRNEVTHKQMLHYEKGVEENWVEREP